MDEPRSRGPLNATYAKARFDAANDDEREELCGRLGGVLRQRLEGGDLHRRITPLIEELRRLGHDQWSFDESDDFEIWAPDYVRSTVPGLVITFTPTDVQVAWSIANRSSTP